MSGRNESESVAALDRNRWPDCSGMGGRFAPEYAHFQMPRVSINEEFMNRESFIEGRFTDLVDLSPYKGDDENG